MAGARELWRPARLQAAGQGDVQVQAVPCVGRCEQAPWPWCTSARCRVFTVDSVLETIRLKPNRALAQHPKRKQLSILDIAALVETSLPAQPG